MSLIVKAEQIVAQVELAGGDEQILALAGMDASGASLRSRRLTREQQVRQGVHDLRVHEHTRTRWEKSRSCLGCKDAATLYYRLAKQQRRAS
jgi:hypothetical protein